MKHLLNNLTEQEKNAIREQHTGGMKVMTEKFSKLVESKLGDSKPFVKESFWSDNFGKPSIEKAAHTSLRGTGVSSTGKDDTNADDHNYVKFDGQKYYEDDIEYAEYNDTGKLPRLEDGKLIIANPAWSL